MKIINSVSSPTTYIDPFSIKGFHFASLQALRNKPKKTGKLHKRLNIDITRTFVPSLKNPLESSSIPALLEISLLFAICRMSPSIVHVNSELIEMLKLSYYSFTDSKLNLSVVFGSFLVEN